MNTERRRIDYLLLAAVSALLALGTVVVFSASASTSFKQFGNPYYYVEHQLMWAVIGILAMIITSRIDYWRYTKLIFRVLFYPSCY